MSVKKCILLLKCADQKIFGRIGEDGQIIGLRRSENQLFALRYVLWVWWCWWECIDGIVCVVWVTCVYVAGWVCELERTVFVCSCFWGVVYEYKYGAEWVICVYYVRGVVCGGEGSVAADRSYRTTYTRVSAKCISDFWHAPLCSSTKGLVYIHHYILLSRSPTHPIAKRDEAISMKYSSANLLNTLNLMDR